MNRLGLTIVYIEQSTFCHVRYDTLLSPFVQSTEIILMYTGRPRLARIDIRGTVDTELTLFTYKYW